MSARLDQENATCTYEGDTSKIPKNDHEAPFLMVHVPSLRNAFFTLSTKPKLVNAKKNIYTGIIPSIDVETSSQAHE
jgi:hypothetical protein